MCNLGGQNTSIIISLALCENLLGGVLHLHTRLGYVENFYENFRCMQKMWLGRAN